MKGLYKSPIFIGLTTLEVDILLENRYRITNYKAGELIASQGSAYNSFLVVDSGVVRGEMINFAGQNVVVEEISAPRAIAPAILFASDNKLPVDVVAVTDVDIVLISTSDFIAIMQLDSRVLHNFMRSISNRSKFLSDRLRIMSFGTIKSKLANYLLERAQFSKSNEFDIPHTHQELADMFGVTRPALSRAISQIAENGIFTSNKKHFHITEIEKLKSIALK